MHHHAKHLTVSGVDGDDAALLAAQQSFGELLQAGIDREGTVGGQLIDALRQCTQRQEAEKEYVGKKLSEHE